MRKRSYKVERRLSKSTDRLEQFFRGRGIPGIGPYDTTHFLVVKMLGEWRCGRNGQERKESIQFIRSFSDEIAIPSHHFRGLLELVKHRPPIHRRDAVQPESKSGDDTEVSATAANCPEQIRIRIGIRLHETAIGEDNIGREKIVDCQPAFAGKMPHAPA